MTRVSLPVALLALAAAMLSQPAAALTRAEGMAPAQGVELYFHAYGEGAPVLILNGGPGLSSRHFAPLAQRIAALDGGRRAILFDQRGTGRSPLAARDASTINVELMVSDVEALRRHLGIERWTVMGHSWGGMYAMAYAVAHPDRIMGLILSASGGSNLEWLEYVGANLRVRLGPERRERYEHWTDPEVTALDPEKANLERVRAMAAAYVFHPEHIPTVVAALSAPGVNHPDVRGLVYRDLQATAFDLREELAGVEAPALIVHGRQDLLGELVPLGTHQALPNSELVWLDECGHYPWLDQPDAYFTAIEGFLARIADRP